MVADFDGLWWLWAILVGYGGCGLILVVMVAVASGTRLI